MRKWLLALFAIVASLVAGVLLQSTFGWIGTPGDVALDDASQEREILYWQAPMNPGFRRDGPGKSPMGMDLIPVYADSASSNPDEVRISPAVENNLGVRTALAERGPLWRRIDATGYVGFDETRMSHIHLRTQGWIEQLAVEAVGERVAAGELLFEIYSPDVVNAQREYLQAQRRADSGLIAAAKEKLLALGVTQRDIDDLAKRGSPANTISVYAPHDGVVTVLNVRQGMHVTPSTVVMSLADLSKVWINAEVFESQVSWVADGQPAQVQLDYLPGQTFEGRVDYIYPVLDPMARTLKVRLVFDNPNESLKPNMYAQVAIFGGPKPDVLSIPKEALIRSGRSDRVVVSLGEGRFAVQEVEAGIQSGDWVEIIRGLTAGDRIVTSSQFLIDSEASLAGSIRRLTKADANDGAQAIVGRGVVTAIDHRTLTLAHEPIAELAWPAMTMDFELAPDLDMPSLSVQEEIHFSLTKGGDGAYQIETIHRMEPAQETDSSQEHSHD